MLRDGCKECERQSKEPGLGIAHLDPLRFVHAWHRAAAWHIDGLDDVSEAEKPMLNVLWCIQLHLDQRRFKIGVVPEQIRMVVMSDPSDLAKQLINDDRQPDGTNWGRLS